MPLSFSLLYDALFATPETYRRLHPALPRRDLPRLPVAQQGVGREKDAGQLENRLFISGGSLAPRLRVLNGAIGQQLGDQSTLFIEEVFYGSPVLFEHLVVAFGYGAGDDQRGTGVIDQHRVHFVDNGVVVFALYEVFR